METIITSVLTATALFLIARFLKNFKSKPKAKNLHFNGNLAAFEFATLNNIASFLPNQMSIGIIRDVIEHETDRQFIIELADSREQKIVSGFNDKNASEIQVGNLIYWGFVDIAENNILNIQAVGHVLAILSPEFNPNTNQWSVRKDLTK